MCVERQPAVVHVVHSLEGGGTEQTLVALLQALEHARHRHVVITLREAGALAGELPESVSCRSLGAKGRSWAAGLTLARWVRKERARVIHGRNVCCWADALIAGLATPAARTVLGFHGLECGGDFSRRDRRVARAALSMGASFTTVSVSGRRMMIDQLGLPAERIAHLPNGVNLSRFGGPSASQRHTLRSSLGIPVGAWVIGSVGALTLVKGVDVLLEALARLTSDSRDVYLLLVGDGPLRKVLVADAHRLGVAERTRFAGWRADIGAMHAVMDVYVCSSRSEGMSNALLEAMASGLATVVTAVGDNPLLVRDGLEGIVVPPNNAESLAKAILAVRASRDAARRLGEAARSRARDFDFARTVSRYEAFYSTCLNEAQQGSTWRSLPLPA